MVTRITSVRIGEAFESIRYEGQGINNRGDLLDEKTICEERLLEIISDEVGRPYQTRAICSSNESKQLCMNPKKSGKKCPIYQSLHPVERKGKGNQENYKITPNPFNVSVQGLFE